jgi:hypothetical protein
MPQASGLAREAGRLWTSDVYHERILRTTCDIIPTVEFIPKDEDVRDLAWDGACVWAMCVSGRIVSYTTDGDPVYVVDGLMDCGWGLAWANGLLWASDPEFSTIYRITLFPATPHLFYREQHISDSLGNNNGRLDPGETAELSVMIANSGGIIADSVRGLLIENDPFLSITAAQCLYGCIPIGESAVNGNEPFVIHADGITPEGYRAELKLILDASGYVDTVSFQIRIGLARGDFLVWDPDPNHSSGPVVEWLLDSLGFAGEYTVSLAEYLGVLPRFQSIWVFCGQYPFREVISRNCVEAESIKSYLNRGGRMYLEGAEVFYYDPLLAMGFDFGPFFGILGVSDGSCDLDTIHGKEGSFAGKMSFAYNGENFWIDRLAVRPSSPACSLFQNGDPVYCCGIACEGLNRRTVGVSFEFSGLVDNDSCSKLVLVDSIMHFFGIGAGVHGTEAGVPRFSLHISGVPNPVHERCLVRYELPGMSTVTMVIYDASGRMVSVPVEGEIQQGDHSYVVDVRRLASGIYFLKLSVDDESVTHKLTVVK